MAWNPWPDLLITLGRATLTRHWGLLVSGVWSFHYTGTALTCGGASYRQAATRVGNARNVATSRSVHELYCTLRSTKKFLKNRDT